MLKFAHRHTQEFLALTSVVYPGNLPADIRALGELAKYHLVALPLLSIPGLVTRDRCFQPSTPHNTPRTVFVSISVHFWSIADLWMLETAAARRTRI